MQCSVSWKGATFSHIGLSAQRRLHLGAAGYTHNIAHERAAGHGLYQRVSAHRLLYFAQYRYACTHMCRGVCVHTQIYANKGSMATARKQNCAQVWVGQVQEDAGHARTMDTRGHGARMQ